MNYIIAPCLLKDKVKYQAYEPTKIIDKSCEFFGITFEDLKKKDRYIPLVEARSHIFYMLNQDEFLRCTYKHIGRLFNRDHSTIIHGCRKLISDMNIYDEVWQKAQAHHKFVYGHSDYLKSYLIFDK
jgi:chromosomal replication initiation ATPase DnaA